MFRDDTGLPSECSYVNKKEVGGVEESRGKKGRDLLKILHQYSLIKGISILV